MIHFAISAAALWFASWIVCILGERAHYAEIANWYRDVPLGRAWPSTDPLQQWCRVSGDAQRKMPHQFYLAAINFEPSRMTIPISDMLVYELPDNADTLVSEMVFAGIPALERAAQKAVEGLLSLRAQQAQAFRRVVENEMVVRRNVARCSLLAGEGV